MFYYQWQTKAKEWEYEQEVRLVMPNPSSLYAALTPAQAKHPKEMWDSREIHRYMPLKGECFDSVYFGVNTDLSEKEKIIRYIRKEINPQIKPFQMCVDENAFRFSHCWQDRFMYATWRMRYLMVYQKTVALPINAGRCGYISR